MNDQKTKPSNNKRRYPRADISYTLHFFLDANAYMEFPHRDISGCGLSFHTDKQYKQDLEMQVSIQLDPKLPAIMASGKVARSWQEGSEWYTAIDLDQVIDLDQEHIDQTVREFLKIQDTKEP